jgi:hypothetical protein
LINPSQQVEGVSKRRDAPRPNFGAALEDKKRSDLSALVHPEAISAPRTKDRGAAALQAGQAP